MITLISADNERFEVSPAAASLSKLISDMIEDGCADGVIPVHNVNGSVLAKVLEYCDVHAALSSASGANMDLLDAFDVKFIDVGLAMLYDLLMAANYLNIEGLLNIAAKKVAGMIKDKTPEQIRQTFGIKPKERIGMENVWIFHEKKKKEEEEEESEEED